MSFETMISSTPMVSDDKMTRLQQQLSLIIIFPLNIFQTSLLYSLQSCTLCTLIMIWLTVIRKLYLKLFIVL